MDDRKASNTSRSGRAGISTNKPGGMTAARITSLTTIPVSSTTEVPITNIIPHPTSASRQALEQYPAQRATNP
jgi:hypothetical protein